MSITKPNQIIDIYGITTVNANNIVSNPRQAIPLTDKPIDSTLQKELHCGPLSPPIGSASYLPEDKHDLGYCTSNYELSKCHDLEFQMNAPSSKCTSTKDNYGLGNCIWQSIEPGKYVQVMSNDENNKYNNKLIPIEDKNTYNSIEWQTILNGGKCETSPGPGYQTFVKCTGSPGSGNTLIDYIKSVNSPGGAIEMYNQCMAPNPLQKPGSPTAKQWGDATCRIFHDDFTRSIVKIPSSDPNMSAFPMDSNLVKPTLLNNIPFNYEEGNLSNLPSGSYCFVPDKDNSCPDIGDIKGELQGIVTPSQLKDQWNSDNWNNHSTQIHLMCKYSVPAGDIVSSGPGGFIKDSDDLKNFTKMKAGYGDFFQHYEGFPENDTTYQYIMLEKCLQPVADDEIKNCMGIDGNYGPVKSEVGLKKNPLGMEPETYWNDAYRLDPVLTSKFSPGTRFYDDDTPRCSIMNTSTEEGVQCRNWYRDLAKNYVQLIEKVSAKKPNPDYRKAILHNNCINKGGTSCGSITIKDVVYKDNDMIPNGVLYDLNQIKVPGSVPIYKPPAGNTEVDWEKTRKALIIGAAPNSLTAAFNKKAKEFCSAPGSQYLWECGCINASAENPENQNHYANLYKAMKFSPAPPNSRYQEGYFQATKDQEDAKYCWLEPCKYPFGSQGVEGNLDINEPVRLSDPTLAGIPFFDGNKDLSLCPLYDCESITITTPDSKIDSKTVNDAIAKNICGSVKNSFYIENPIVCKYGPSSAPGVLNRPYSTAAPGDVNLPPGQIRDPGNWCVDTSAPGAGPTTRRKISDEGAFMLAQQCFNGCHNWHEPVQQPQDPIPYTFPTYNCTSTGCKEVLPSSPGVEGMGEFFEKSDCEKECYQKEREEKVFTVLMIVAFIVFCIFIAVLVDFFIKRSSRKSKSNNNI